MSFFINNPWALVISVIIIVFLILMGIKIYKEVSLNSLLKQKHQYMRLDVRKGDTGFRKRIGILTSATLAPIATVVIVLIVGINITSISSGNPKSFDDSVELNSLYEDISFYVSQDEFTYRSFPGDTSTDSGIEKIDDIDASIIENFYNIVTSATEFGEIYGSEDLSKDVHNDDYYYGATDNVVEVTLNSNDGVSKEGTQFVDSIVYTGNTTSCINEYLIKGLNLTEEYLTVVALEYPSQCLGVEVDEEYLYDKLNVLVSVFNVDDMTEVTNYRLSGNLASVKFSGDFVYITTKRYINYSEEIFDVQKYLPYYKINGATQFEEYEDILYVEGVTPDSYTSIYGIDILNQKVDMETLLVSYNSDIYIYDDEIQVSSLVYYLSPFAGIFDLEDPYKEYKEILFKYRIIDGKVDNTENTIS